MLYTTAYTTLSARPGKDENAMRIFNTENIPHTGISGRLGAGENLIRILFVCHGRSFSFA